MAMYAEASSAAATYPPITGPQSSWPNIEAVMGRGRVSSRAMPTSVMPAANLPSTRSRVRTGSVSRTSSVPIFCSSLHCRMVTAATRKIRRNGSDWNSGRTSAMFRAKNFA
jgi:hypothetical protein